MPARRPRHPTRPTGFALVMVLVILAVAGTIMAAAARTSSRVSLEAEQARDDLQLRWAQRSCTNLVLPIGEFLLTVAEARRQEPVSSAAYELDLGELTVRMLLSDEQAKANVNRIAERGDEIALARAVRTLTSLHGVPLPVRPRPGRFEGSLLSLQRSDYTSYQQLWAFERPEQLIGLSDRTLTPGLTRELTCWGNGRAHVRRASPEALRVVTAGVLNDTERHELVSFRQKRPDATLADALRHLELPPDRAADVRDVLCETSGCHSLWLVVEGPSRRWVRLTVAQEGDAEIDSLTWTFRW